MKRIFKNLTQLSGLLLIALMFTYCDKAEKPDEEGNEITEIALPQISAQFAPFSTTEGIDTTSSKTRWNENDQIKAFVVPNGINGRVEWPSFEHKYITDAENCVNSTFLTRDGDRFEGGKTYNWYVMSPFNAEVKDPKGGAASNSQFSYNGQIQDLKDPLKHLTAYDIMTATAENIPADQMPIFQMERKSVLMKMLFKNTDRKDMTLKQIDFIAPEGIYIGGTYSIDFSPKGKLHPKQGSEKAVLKFSGEKTIHPGETFEAYLMMPPFTLEAELPFTLKLSLKEGLIEREIVTEKVKDFVSGNLYTLSQELNTQDIISITLNKTELFMPKGNVQKLIAKISPENTAEKKLIWKSDEPKVAKVDEFGNVIAITDGSATISVRIDGTEIMSTCKIKVAALDKSHIALKEGENGNIKLKGLSADGGNVQWKTSHPEVATVDMQGNITTHKTGHTAITAYIGDEGMAMSAALTVYPKDVDQVTIMVGELPISMIKVHAGKFTMGATPEHEEVAKDKEKPAHEVTLTKDYYIGQFEVTQELWGIVMDTIPCHYAGHLAFPVEHINWFEIVNEFLPKLNKMTGKKFVLPTEAQWEYAARGGEKTHHYLYSGSNNIDEVAWYEDNSIDPSKDPDGFNYDNFDGKRHPHNVGTKLPNELGIYDMTGNVYEWCNDWYGPYSADAQVDPQGASSGRSKILRGGSFDFQADYSRVAFRDTYYPYYWHFRYGFRLALQEL